MKKFIETVIDVLWFVAVALLAIALLKEFGFNKIPMRSGITMQDALFAAGCWYLLSGKRNEH